jgi:hypothetical protein
MCLGKDATRAFVTGDFSVSGLIDDVSGLSHQDMLGIEEWQTFYERDYEFVGAYFDIHRCCYRSLLFVSRPTDGHLLRCQGYAD